MRTRVAAHCGAYTVDSPLIASVMPESNYDWFVAVRLYAT